MATKKEIEKMFLLELLELCKAMPVLWKVKSEDYHNRAKKADAYNILLKMYQEHFTTGTLEDMKKKINTMRTNFRNELRKMEKSAKSGAGSEDLYESQAWFMKSMMFLKDQETPATSINTLSKNDEEIIQDGDGSEESTKDNESEDCEWSFTATALPLPESTKPSCTSQSVPRFRKRKPVPKSKKAELLSLAKARLTEPHDPYLSQAKTWAHELKRLDARQELFAKKAINDILFEARCGTLNKNSVQINCDINTSSSSRCSTPYYPHVQCHVQTEPAASFMDNFQGGQLFSQEATESSSNQSNLSTYFSNVNPNA